MPQTRSGQGPARRCNPVYQYLFLCLLYGCGRWLKNQAKQILGLSTLVPPTHLSILAHSTSLASYIIKMVKEPQMTRTNTRYDPYNSSRRAHRRRGSPPPDNWGRRAQTHQYSLDGSIYNFLEDLCMRYRGDGLHHLFREYASQSGALGQAIKAWLQFDDVSRLLTSSSWPPSRLPCTSWLMRDLDARVLPKCRR